MLGLAVLSHLPRRAMVAVCDFASAFMFVFDRKGRAHAHENLSIMFPGIDPGRERTIVRRSYRTMARSVGHAFWTCRKAVPRAMESGEMSMACAEFLAANKPAVAVSGHIGCWEILSQLAFIEGHSMMSVAKDVGSKSMTSLLMKARKSIGQEIVPFFSAKSGAPILVAWSRPLPDGRYRCELVSSYTSAEARDIWGMTQRCALDLEGVIRRHPSAWALNYNAFRKHPKENEMKQLEEREGKWKKK